jgi:deferrochelatase/peroxidase EfeB
MPYCFEGYQGRGRSFPECNPVLAEVQNLVRFGYKNCSRRTYLLGLGGVEPIATVRREKFERDGIILLCDGMPKGAIGRLWGLREKLLSGDFGQACSGIDIGITYEGLKHLNVKPDLLEVFRRKSPAYSDNAFLRAPKHLGDSGVSAPQYWHAPYQVDKAEKGIHIVLVAHFPLVIGNPPLQECSANVALFESVLMKCVLDLEQSFTLASPLDKPWIEVSAPLDEEGTEHFGYKDGITAPVYASCERREILQEARREKHIGYRVEHALGEVLLGYPRNDGNNLYANLGITRKANTNIGLQPVPAQEKDKVFFKNSSFGVLRKIEQRVDVFEKWVQEQAQQSFPQDIAFGIASGSEDPYFLSKKWVRSKILGRTPEGVMLTPELRLREMTDAALEVAKRAEMDKDEIDKRFHRTDDAGNRLPGNDAEGRGCPFSSHIRRMNPRDDSVTPFIHRPLLRRGMPYTQTQKGLMGLFFCADIVEQFEHLVGIWAHHRVMGIPDDSTCRDPLIGNHEPQGNHFFLDSHDDGESRNLLKFEEPFVITRGCAYLWFPSLAVLNNFAEYTK